MILTLFNLEISWTEKPHIDGFPFDPDAVYARKFELDVSDLVPQVTYGFKPDEVKDITEIEGARIDQVYIGSCTNGRIEDLREAARIIGGRKLAEGVRGILSPATPKVYSEAMAEGIIQQFMEAQWDGMNYATIKDFEEPVETGVPGPTLNRIANQLHTLPEELVFFKKSIKLVEDRARMIRENPSLSIPLPAASTTRESVPSTAFSRT